VRRITLFIFGGVAEIGEQPPSAAAEFWIAVAGPAVSLALAILFGSLTLLFADTPPLLALTTYLAYVNAALFLFNLVPGFPLDGGRVFRALVWGLTDDLSRATVVAGTVGRFIGFGFVMFGVWQLLRGNFVGGVWIMLVGWFLETAAVAQIHQQQARHMLTGYRVANVMNRDWLTVQADEKLQTLVDERILGGGRRCFIVADGDAVVGLVTLHQVSEVARSEWPTTTVGRVMIPVSRMKWIAPDTGLWTALKKMNRDGVNQLPVLSHGTLVGILAREDAISFMQTVQELDVRSVPRT
jgi:CBS domain-containing protein